MKLQQPFTIAESGKHGISRQMLAHYCRQGKLEHICRGVYAPHDVAITPHPELETLLRKNSEFVVCLISSLQIHEFTTQIANALWIAIPHGSRCPSIPFPVNCIRLTRDAYSYGIEERELNGFAFKVYSAAKTVADCFKFRNKIGLDVALEALKEGLQRKLFTPTELYNAAKVCRVHNIIRPYMEMFLS